MAQSPLGLRSTPHAAGSPFGRVDGATDATPATASAAILTRHRGTRGGRRDNHLRDRCGPGHIDLSGVADESVGVHTDCATGGPRRRDDYGAVAARQTLPSRFHPATVRIAVSHIRRQPPDDKGQAANAPSDANDDEHCALDRAAHR